jgi:hypothetical protein
MRQNGACDLHAAYRICSRNFRPRVFYAPRFFSGQNRKKSAQITRANTVTKTTDTHSEYVTLIAFPLQRRLHERSSMLRYTLTACLVKVYLGALPSSLS